MDRLRLLGILHQEWGIRAYQKRATAEILAEYDRLTALNAQLLKACKFSHSRLQVNQIEDVSETIFVLEAAIRAAEEGGEA
jgi:hypothetical protein